MEKVLAWIEKYLMPVITALAEHKHLRAVRDGMVAILPLIIVGSFFLLLGQLPFKVISEEFLNHHLFIKSIIAWYDKNTSVILVPFRLTIKLMALFAAYTIAYNLAKNYKLDGISCGVLSMTCFLLTQKPLYVADLKNWFLSMEFLGGPGLFTAILAAFFTVSVAGYCKSKDIGIKMPEGVPPAVSMAFNSLVPATIIISYVWLIVHVCNVDIAKMIFYIFTPLIRYVDTLWAVILITLIMHLIWLGGIHGASVAIAVFYSIWLEQVTANADAMAIGVSLPYITSISFYQWFVWIGGSGATLSLAFLMLKSKIDFIKQLGRLSIIPGICNINEPIIFGLPITMNPVLAVPFLLTPIVNVLISYSAITLGLVNRPSSLVPWTLPAPIGGFLATAFDWRALVLIAVNIFISFLIYLPFFKEYEKVVFKKEGLAEL